MKKKIFLGSGLFLFVVGVFYIYTNYEIVYYPEDQPGLPLESLSIIWDGKIELDRDTPVEVDGGFRLGDFVIRPK